MYVHNEEICYRMFTSIKKTFSKLIQSPFGVVKAEDDELVDPHRVLRVCFNKMDNFLNNGNSNVKLMYRQNVNSKKKHKHDSPYYKNVMIV